MFSKKSAFLIVFVIIIVSFFVWRGIPPFQLRTDSFPGLLISHEQNPTITAVKIYKSQRKFELYGDGQIIGIFKIGLGFAPSGDKEVEGDGKTPVGKFAVCYINKNTPYVYFYGLNYPNLEDAERGLSKGLISQKEYEQILQAVQSGATPLWQTPLGGEVGIHGGGNLLDWSAGCVTVSDTDILILEKYLTLGTVVEIKP
ncbi:MAG: L,D-transpeptidase family protein [Sporomusaceae bacterium]|jgi:murein L,D-transpeptidase YafK|nr:L,D-transpeptidase family protein [Sporomusaceae bacterium]